MGILWEYYSPANAGHSREARKLRVVIVRMIEKDILIKVLASLIT